MNLVNNYKKKPNFEISNLNDNNEVGEVGVETVYEDTNNVLSTFSIAETKNCTARIDGIKIIYYCKEILEKLVLNLLVEMRAIKWNSIYISY